MKPLAIFACCVAAFAQSAVNVTVLNQKNSAAGVNGRLQNFMSTSFQPAEWDFQFFQQLPTATMPLWNLAPQHIRIQPVSQGVPLKAPNQWDFADLDAVVIPVLSVGDHSPELQLATAPSFMNDAQGHLMRAHFPDFAAYCANIVRYYNKGGFDAGGKHYQSPSPYPIHWWGIFNEPNINGIAASDYVGLYNLVVPAMQAVDPSIRFVAVELSDFGSESQNYIPAFVQGVTARVDVLGTHYYSSCNQQDPDQVVMNTVAVFASDIQYLYSQLRTNPALAGVPVWVTENNENADFDSGNGISACNGTPFVLDTRGTSAFFAAWRPFLFSQLAQARAQSLYHWDFDADAQFGEVDYGTGNTYLSYWVDYYLAHLFPYPPGADILRVDNTNAGAIEALAARNDDGSVVVMLANHHVRSATDNNGAGVPHTVNVDVSALGTFGSAAQITIDASTDPSKGPAPQSAIPAAHMQVTLNGYGVSFLRLNQPKPQFEASDVSNAASYAGGGVSPGEIVVVLGTGLGPGTLTGAQVSSPGVVDNLLAGTRVWFDGIAAPLIYTSAKVVCAVVPYEVAGKTITMMQVEYLGAMSDPVAVQVVDAVPGIFTNDASGAGQAAIINLPDGSRNSAAHPATRGSKVSIYATGEGQTTPAGADGKIVGSVLPKPVLNVSVEIGGLPATVLYAGAGPGIVSGGLVINAQVPANVTPGNAVPVVVTVGTASSRSDVTMAVN